MIQTTASFRKAGWSCPVGSDYETLELELTQTRRVGGSSLTNGAPSKSLSFLNSKKASGLQIRVALLVLRGNTSLVTYRHAGWRTRSETLENQEPKGIPARLLDNARPLRPRSRLHCHDIWKEPPALRTPRCPYQLVHLLGMTEGEC